MTQHYRDLTFGPEVRAAQISRGSQDAYADAGAASPEGPDVFTRREWSFLSSRDEFYLATTTEGGWPYVQYRGGPIGFIRPVDEKTIGWAEFSGNLQYISTGNVSADDRAALIFVDYARKRRLKLLGRVTAYKAGSRPDLARLLDIDGHRCPVEGYMVVRIEAFDWNCPQHIVSRFSMPEVEQFAATLRRKIQQLEARLAQTTDADRAIDGN